MKKLYIFSFLLILSATNIFSQSGWYITHPFPNTLEGINDIYFINNSNGFLVTGEYAYPNAYGRIYKTTNSGVNWESYLYDSLGYLNKIYFIDVNTGFIYGSNLYKTTDSGVTWIKKGTGFKSISFVNAMTGYACGYGGEYRVMLSKTINGGETWNNYNTDITGYYLTMFDIYFKNLSTGLIVGEDCVCAKTTNGGINWIYKLPRYWGIYTDITVFNDSTYFITGNNQDSLILRSSNYGENWSTLNTQFTGSAFMNSIEFNMNFNGYCVGSFSKILKSTNNNTNWSEIPNPFQGLYNSSSSLNKVLFLNANTGFIVGDYCSFIKSTNSGNNWEVLIRGDTLNAVSLINKDYGFSGGHNGHLMKTINSGINWLDVNSGTNNTINDMHFKDSLNGIYVASAGAVGTTTNSGFSWNVQTLNNQIKLNDVYLFNNTSGLVVGDNGKIFKTTNFGLNWSEKNSNVLPNLNSVFVSTNNISSSVGDSGIFITSIDLGENWTNSYITPKVKLNSVYFLNPSTGYIVGESGKVFRSTNGGLNWVLQLPYTNENLNYISFLNENTGFIIGNKRTCLKTTNGGMNWGMQSLRMSLNCNLKKIFFLDSISLIVGDDGYILKSTDGGGYISLGINPINEQIPQTFSLHQNYPNPFNPITKIKFDIPQRHLPLQGGDREGVLLKIYDLLGREITTLVNEQLSPGTYSVDWDGTAFASGVYFYSLITDDFTETKRMVLIK